MIYSVTLNPCIDYIIHVDHFNEGKLNRSTQDYTNIGGKGIMVSKLLKNIGVENTALGFLGGFTGEHINNWFKKEGMKERFVRVDGNTRINVKLKSETESEINGMGPKISTEEEVEFLKVISDIQEGDTVVISGSSSPGLSDDIFEKIIDIIKSKGADFVIDTAGERLVESIRKKPLLIKPNMDEIGEIFGRDFHTKEEIIPFAKKCMNMGAKYVIVSMGGNGALFLDGEKIYFAPRVEGVLVNSVGAGDSMIAGFVGSIKSGKTPLESFKFSVACGTATAFCEDIALDEDIKKILKKVVVEEIL